MTAVTYSTGDVRALLPECHGCVTPCQQRVVWPLGSAVVVRTVKTVLGGRSSRVGNRIAVRRERGHLLDEHVDPALLHLEPAVAPEQARRAQFEGGQSDRRPA